MAAANFVELSQVRFAGMLNNVDLIESELRERGEGGETTRTFEGCVFI